jgi:two-component system chemotaxis sensor kinase CheA
MDTNQYLSMFIEESREHLQAMNDHLLQLENEPDDIDIVNRIFRSAHTLKGMSATMGFEDLAALTHQMENVLDLNRSGKLAMNEDILDTLFLCLDALESMVNDIVNGGTGQLDVSGIVAKLKAIESGEQAPAAAGTSAAPQAGAGSLDQYQLSILKQSMQSDHQAFHIHVALREDCMLKAARAYMVFGALEQNGEIIKSTPSVEDIEQEKFERSFSVYYVSRLSKDDVAAMIGDISEIEKVDVKQLDEAALQELERGASQAARKETAAASAAVKAAPGAAEAGQAARKTAAPVAGRTIRVDIERLDVLMNLFSELLIDRVRLESIAAEIRRADLTETVEHMARVSSDLQNIVMKLRMVPVETVFNRFPRMVRDLAKSLDKKIDLIITGADTELDRTVIDEIGDPLVHLLRNAVDHGIDSPEERIKAGKPETGTVHLRAFHSGNSVFIEIEDDGRGIRRDKVLDKAIKNGIISAEQADTMSDEDVYQLLFASGFSTAEKISDVSGRGVGLDVVRAKITALGGSVTVRSELGKGTVFSVQLPLTVSIINAMLIRIAGEKYAIPLSSILETAVIRDEDIRRVHGNTFVSFREHVVPLVFLREVFECPEPKDGGKSEPDDEYPVVVVRKGDKMAAVVVDELIGQQEIVLKSLGKYLTNLFAISGATILGDGQVALIVDTNALVK